MSFIYNKSLVNYYKKRNAELEVKVVPSRTKFDNDVVFIVTVKDVTKNATNTTCLTDNANVILKINGLTLKDDDGQIIQFLLTTQQ